MNETKQEAGSEIVELGLSPQEELFCQVYVNDSNAMGNGLRSYAKAYNYNLEQLEGETDQDYKKRYNIGCSRSYDILRIPRIKQRIAQILAEMLNNGFVDNELVKIIKQDNKLEPKLNAIREYNKLKARILDKLDLQSGGEPLEFSISEAIARKVGLIHDETSHGTLESPTKSQNSQPAEPANAMPTS